MEESKQIRMGTKPMLPLILSMALPAMMSMLVQALYNIVDSYFVAKVSEDALTAVSLVFPVQNLLIAVAIGTGVGLNSLISRRLGEGRFEDASSAATHGLLLAVFNWLFFALIGLVFSRTFLSLFIDKAAVVEMGTQYMSIVCIASLGLCMEGAIEKTLQGTGNMIYPMISQLIGAVTNIILDPIFIFGLFGMPRMEVAGAAIATVLGQSLAMLFLFYVLARKEKVLKINLKGFRFHGGMVKEIYAVGFPSIIMQSIGSVMTMGMNAILIKFTETAVAFFGVYFKLQSFVFMPVFGLNQGVMPVIGYNFGARKRKRVTSAVTVGCSIAVLIMAAGMVVFWAIPAELLGIFNASPTMLKIGVPALRTISLCFVPAALGIMFSTAFQALGHGFNSLLISILRQLVVLLPAAFLLANIGLDAVWFSFPLAECASFAASIYLYWKLHREVIRPLPEE
mgnify:CR=1 FL=1